MTNITCEICMDLIPLVYDGIASEDSCQAVRSHIENCEHCRAVFEGDIPEKSNIEISINKINRWLQLFAIMILIIGICLGISLADGNNFFYNVLIMPILGIVAYYVFHWKSVYIVPTLLLVIQFIAHLIEVFQGKELFSISKIIFYIILYNFFAVIGILIAGLLHFAFKKEKEHE